MNTIETVKKNNSMKSLKRRNAIFIYGFLAWPVFQWLVFWVYPNIGMVVDSFFRDSVVAGKIFVDFENYEVIFKGFLGQQVGSLFTVRMLTNTFSLIPLTICINMVLMIIFAYALYKKVLLHGFFRIVLFLPSVLSAVVLCLCFKMSLDPDVGLIGAFIKAIGLGGDGTPGNMGVFPVGGFLGNDETVWGSILIFNVWTGVSGQLIYFNSAMARLPASVFESAELDGATEMQQFFKLCIPLIFPTINTLIISTVAGCLSWMMPALLLAGSNPNASSIGLVITQIVKSDSKNTVVCAFGVLVSIVGTIVVLTLHKLLDKYGQEVEY